MVLRYRTLFWGLQIPYRSPTSRGDVWIEEVLRSREVTVLVTCLYPVEIHPFGYFDNIVVDHTCIRAHQFELISVMVESLTINIYDI